MTLGVILRNSCKSRFFRDDYLSVTMVAAVRLSGPMAAMSFVGAMNQERFEAWLAECLVPRLQEGDVVILDGSSCHKSAKDREILGSIVIRF